MGSRFLRGLLPLLLPPPLRARPRMHSLESVQPSKRRRCGLMAPPRIGTHNGTFHCDEALACALLRLLPEYQVRGAGGRRVLTWVPVVPGAARAPLLPFPTPLKPSSSPLPARLLAAPYPRCPLQDAEIVRTRDPEKLASCDVVVDVGGEYDPQRHRYDHHQRWVRRHLLHFTLTQGPNSAIRCRGCVASFHPSGSHLPAWLWTPLSLTCPGLPWLLVSPQAPPSSAPALAVRLFPHQYCFLPS